MTEPTEAAKAKTNIHDAEEAAAKYKPEWLYDLPSREWDKFTNHGPLHLRDSKQASEPCILREGACPPPVGTRVSIWHPGDRSQQFSGWWVSTTAKREVWREELRRGDGVVIFRFRDARDIELLNGKSPQQHLRTDQGRIADALERIADLLEQFRTDRSEKP